MKSTPDARLFLGLVGLSVAALITFLWLGLGALTPQKVLRRPSWSGGAEQVSESGTTFLDVTEEVGLAGFRHDTGGLRSLVDTVAPGLGLLDLDGDEDLDLVLMTGGGSPDQRAGVAIFLNQMTVRGSPVFEDATAQLGVSWRGRAQGVCAGDYDRDGDVDLFITAIGPNLLLQNQLDRGQLGFRDVTETAGVAGGTYHVSTGAESRIFEGPAPSLAALETAIRTAAQSQPGDPAARTVRETAYRYLTEFGLGELSIAETAERIREGVEWPPPGLPQMASILEFSTGASFGDFDQDGDLDLFVANYVSYDESLEEVARTRDEPYRFQPNSFPAQKDRLYRNDGGGTFSEVGDTIGLNVKASRSLTALMVDLDRDLYPEIVVATDEGVNRVFRNLPRTQTAAYVEASEYYQLVDPRSSRGIARGDTDGDADLDLLFTNWRDEPASLMLFGIQLTAGIDAEPISLPLFTEADEDVGLAPDSTPGVGWGVALFDYDNDTDLDCVIAQGGSSPRGGVETHCAPQPILLFKNDGGRFLDVSNRAGAPFKEQYNARGLVAGDVDRDGDLDLVIAQNNAAVLVWSNELAKDPDRKYLPASPREFRRLRLAVVGRVFIAEYDQRTRTQRHQVLSGGSFLSQPPLQPHLGMAGYELDDGAGFFPPAR